MAHPADKSQVHEKKRKGRLRGCLNGIVIWIAFISILFLLIPQFHPAYTELEDTAAPLIKALARYKVERGNYPEKIEALVPKYIVSIPICPGKNMQIPYFKEKKINEYELICYGFFTHKLRYRSRTGEWDSFD